MLCRLKETHNSEIDRLLAETLRLNQVIDDKMKAIGLVEEDLANQKESNTRAPTSTMKRLVERLRNQLAVKEKQQQVRGAISSSGTNSPSRRNNNRYVAQSHPQEPTRRQGETTTGTWRNLILRNQLAVKEKQQQVRGAISSSGTNWPSRRNNNRYMAQSHPEEPTGRQGETTTGAWRNLILRNQLAVKEKQQQVRGAISSSGTNSPSRRNNNRYMAQSHPEEPTGRQGETTTGTWRNLILGNQLAVKEKQQQVRGAISS